LLASGGAIGAGIILERIAYPLNYAATFSIACIWLLISWFFINATREPPHEVDEAAINQSSLWSNMLSILQTDRNFSWLLVSRMLSQFGIMGFAFYSVHVVKNLGATEFQAGLMTSVLMVTQVVMNIGLGWLADRWSRKGVLEIGFVAMGLSALLAWLAPSFNWFYLVMILTGTAYTALWTIMMALTLQFGGDDTRPTYVGMANTLITPFTILAPFVGGWLATITSYQSTFLASMIFSVAAILCLHFTVRDPKKLRITQSAL
jgi:MFS family permease